MIKAKGSEHVGSQAWLMAMRWGLIAEAFLMLLTAAIIGDGNALIIAMLLLVGAFALRNSRRWVPILSGLLLVNIAFWTIAGAASNMTHSEGVADVLIPALHAGVALAGFTLPLYLVLRKMDPGSASRATRTAAVFPLVVAAIMVGTSVLTGPGDSQGPIRSDIKIISANTSFMPERISSDSSRISVFMKNEDLFWHTFTIDDLGVDLKVPFGGSRRTSFAVSPGTYEFYCRIPGHVAAGMKGQLIVG